MRITTFLFMAYAFCSYAESSHSLNTRISINKSNVLLDEILSDIEYQTHYLFVYNNEVDVDRKVSVRANYEPVSGILDNVLENTNICYPYNCD